MTMVKTMGMKTVFWLILLHVVLLYPSYQARRNSRDTRILTKGKALVVRAPDLRKSRTLANIRAFQSTFGHLNQVKVGRLLEDECPSLDSLFDVLPQSDIQSGCSLVLLTKGFAIEGSAEDQGRFILYVTDINDLSSARLLFRIRAWGKFTMKISTITANHPGNRSTWQALTDTYKHVIEPRDLESSCYQYNITRWFFMESLKSSRRAMRFAVDLRCEDDDISCMRIMDAPILVTSSKLESHRCDKGHRIVQSQHGNPSENRNMNHPTGPDLRDWKLTGN